MPLHKVEYRAALNELISLEFTGMKLGLDNIRTLLSTLGNPQKKFKSIHVAGSNGKGSVSAMLASVMQANGYKTGLYTSPHLVDFRERIKINGEMISEEYVADFLQKIWSEVERIKATFFEVTTALAFNYFADNCIDIAIIETGLGGRLDATNVLENLLATVITSISLEHTAQLGKTLEQIAGEKAGIIKKGVPAIVNVSHDLRKIFIKKAEELDTSVQFVADFKNVKYIGLAPPFFGEHQKQNLQTVLATISRLDLSLVHKSIIQGIQNTIPSTAMRGRLEEYDYPPAREKHLTLILDVAHNPDAFRYLKKYFQELGIKPIIIAGFAKDKDIPAILKEISEFATCFIAVTANSHRAISPEELGSLAKKEGLHTFISTSPKAGIEAALKIALEGETLLLTGSHFVVGDFLAVSF